MLFELRQTRGDGVRKAECTVRCLARTAAEALRLRETVRGGLTGQLSMEGWTGIGAFSSGGLRWLNDAERFEGWAVFSLILAPRD